jgi:hypothetical protein
MEKIELAANTVISKKLSKLQRCFNFKVGKHFTKFFTAIGTAVVATIHIATCTLFGT